MKQGWEIKKLGEIATYINGYAFKPEHWGEDGLPIIRIQNLNNPNAEFNYCSLDVPDKYVIDNGDILISWSASLGVYEWNQGKAYLNQHIFKVLFNKIDINKFFFKYAIGAKIKDMIKNAHGATMKHIVKGDFDNTPIPVPPLPVQEQIVSELDLLSGIIEKKREQLKELDTLAQSIFYDMFGDPITNEKGWEVKKLGEVFCVKIGPFGSLLHNSDYVLGGVPLVNPIHMQDEHICPDVNLTISDTKIKELQSYILHTNDIVLARRGDIGRCAIVGENEDGYLCGTGSLFIRATTAIISTYIIKLFRSNSMIRHLTSLAKGATMLNINCKIIENLVIPIPPLPLQHQFATKIEAIEKQKELIKQSISETETLFNERMQEHFG